MMKRFLKGFVIGIGKIIPGVSGAILAISLGVYDKSIYYINNFKANKKESIKYLLPLALGILLSIIVFSRVISYLLIKYYVMTILFFVGLIIGTFSSVLENVHKKDYYLVIISLIIFLSLSLIGVNNDYLLKGNIIDTVIFLISGIFEAVGSIVPGISSTALLMNIGTYKIIINSIGSIMELNFLLDNLKILIPFVFGIFIGAIMAIKVIDYMFKRFYHKMYAIILGLLISTIIIMIIRVFKESTTVIQLFIGIILMMLGIFISTLFDK